MAQRRMFSLKIVDTDSFLDMPQSSQLLYFHLSMRADDDGFVSNPKKIMRMTGINEDDLKVLITKKFIIPFNNGICVIKHWKIHNYIQKDRYTKTTYLEEKALLHTKENRSYTLDTKYIQNVSTGKVRLDKSKDSLVKSEKKEKIVKFSAKDIEMTDLLVSLIQKNSPEWQMRGNKDTWAENIEKLNRIDERSYEQIEFMIRWVQGHNFWHKNILSTAKLREKFNDLIPRLQSDNQVTGTKKQIFV